MFSSKVRSGVAVAVIGLALFATLGESSTDSGSSSNPAPNAGQSTGEPAAPESSAAAPIPLATPTSVASGWELTVNSANLNANATIAAANRMAQPAPGTNFVLVNVTLANKSGKPSPAYVEVDISMLPPSGVAIDTSGMCSSYAAAGLDTMAQMQPGSVQTGDLCFEVKEAEIATSLLLAEPQFTLDDVKDQRFFAIQ